MCVLLVRYLNILVGLGIVGFFWIYGKLNIWIFVCIVSVFDFVG